MADLDPRQQSILHAIIVEYVRGAEPVASEMLVQNYPLGVKSATVRNEMAEMSEMGYLEQPHTSAGRVPSDQGYRYYVDKLIVKRELAAEARQQVKTATEDGDALQTLLRDTARTLSRITHQLTVATTVRHSDVAVRTAMVSALGPKQALLVLVLSNGHIENRMLECPAGLTLEDVGAVNDSLRSATAGKALRGLTRTKAPAASAGAPEKLMATVWGSIRTIARELTRGLLITEGEEFMLAQPEFQRDVSLLNGLLETLHDADILHDAVNAPGEGVESVTIGRENRQQQLRQLSVIRRTFFVGETEAGVIAIVGPTRTQYERSIPLVHFTARALSDSLTRFLG